MATEHSNQKIIYLENKIWGVETALLILNESWYISWSWILFSFTQQMESYSEQTELFLDFLQERSGFSVWSDFPEMFLQSLGLQENQIKYCFISNKEG